ncbi:DNA-binding response regulator [Paenibacillus sp. 1011MAR3C5]|uniref:response regulator transcription factor n=1 Tax=Paenibacillus sp. 1011MAR3C5 TaxID=1675787 RepID=UPI000E6CE16E|nr:response regulator transcription factor [Paenibacillus sp. 1011MAR3C5]RJE90135.1 DNA-binding response regulator [Paenibacillus sp. 1011MAR3C5]
MARVLIVEDDRSLNEGLAYALKQELFEVITAYSGEEALELFRSHDIHLLLLDVNLPGQNGRVLCEEIRKMSSVPIIFLTAKDTDEDMIAGFQSGADDYIAKPFSMAVLSQRIKAVLRRGGAPGNTELFTYKDLTIHYDKMKVFKHQEELKLTTSEYKLLAMLAKNSKQVMTREIMLEKLWDMDGLFVDENTLSVNIRRLRAKIEDNPKHPVYIKTVFGIGYTWGD